MLRCREIGAAALDDAGCKKAWADSRRHFLEGNAGRAAMNTGVIDRFLETFTRYIDSGFGLLGGEIGFLTSTLIVIDITLAGLFWAWGADEDVLQRLIKKTLYIGFFAFIIGNFNRLAGIVFNPSAALASRPADRR
jgi:type IV secretory pathway TrbL component